MRPVPIIDAHRSARRYHDPIDLIWTSTAQRLGMTIARSSEVYASWDGADTLTLGTPDTLDSDDCLAQMIFHEICHWITNGAESIHQVDWGFEPTEHVDWKEYPAVGLQAWLAAPHGLRQLLGPTTNVRPYYDALAAVGHAPTQHLQMTQTAAMEQKIADRTRRAILLAQTDPWWRPLQRALTATAAVHRATQPFASDDQLWGWPSESTH